MIDRYLEPERRHVTYPRDMVPSSRLHGGIPSSQHDRPPLGDLHSEPRMAPDATIESPYRGEPVRARGMRDRSHPAWELSTNIRFGCNMSNEPNELDSPPDRWPMRT